MSQTPIYTAILNDGTIYKHWTLFIDAPPPHQKLSLNALGSSEGVFRYECTEITGANNNPRDNPGLEQLYHLCDIDTADAGKVRDVAGQLKIRNEVKGWNCQDFVLDLLEALEEKGIVDTERGDGRYGERKERLRGMQDGLA
ncbi:hypothetical protein AJ79_06999 [Helicocarpus griseus UAMH5409]|uniref:Uncharacterized protein n=1 Tax=Helicocarpus griseus UAMH5409 TaxID=1447875 RepID=A0A2B7X768_9EURO|nr:hypothetical protein AJ79_06999 [Helicocarpus griseus UAMH5409]